MRLANALAMLGTLCLISPGQSLNIVPREGWIAANVTNNSPIQDCMHERFPQFLADGHGTMPDISQLCPAQLERLLSCASSSGLDNLVRHLLTSKLITENGILNSVEKALLLQQHSTCAVLLQDDRIGADFIRDVFLESCMYGFLERVGFLLATGRVSAAAADEAFLLTYKRERAQAKAATPSSSKKVVTLSASKESDEYGATSDSEKECSDQYDSLSTSEEELLEAGKVPNPEQAIIEASPLSDSEQESMHKENYETIFNTLLHHPSAITKDGLNMVIKAAVEYRDAGTRIAILKDERIQLEAIMSSLFKKIYREDLHEVKTLMQTGRVQGENREYAGIYACLLGYNKIGSIILPLDASSTTERYASVKAKGKPYIDQLSNEQDAHDVLDVNTAFAIAVADRNVGAVRKFLRGNRLLRVYVLAAARLARIKLVEWDDDYAAALMISQLEEAWMSMVPAANTANKQQIPVIVHL